MKFRRLILPVVAATAFVLIALYGMRPILAVYEDARLLIRDQRRAFHRAAGWALPETPDYTAYTQRLKSKDLEPGAPIYLRIFKRDSELELWMRKGSTYVLFQTYPICYWSGGLGPKLHQGDGQSPEGFYTVTRGRMNPNSEYHLSFDLGFPNSYDRAHGRTGAYLMVHGDCVSRGCYAMTDAGIEEIWRLANAAFDGGQQSFPVHVFPFRLENWRLDLYANHRWASFWRELKPAYDAFYLTRTPPEIIICGKSYYTASDAAGNAGASRCHNHAALSQ